MAGDYGDGEKIDTTDGWKVGLLFAAFEIVSVIFDYLFRYLDTITKGQRRGIYLVLKSMKLELLLLGLISLFLIVFEEFIVGFCIKDSKAVDGYGDCPPGEKPFWSSKTLHQTHLLVFVIAIMYIFYTGVTMVLCLWKVHAWHKYEEAGAKDPEMHRLPSRTRARLGGSALTHWLRTLLAVWYENVDKDVYCNVRLLAIHRMQVSYDWDFHTFVVCLMELQIAKAVEVQWVMWLAAAVIISLPERSYAIFIFAGIANVIMVVVASKLASILTYVAAVIPFRQLDTDALINGLEHQDPRRLVNGRTLSRTSIITSLGQRHSLDLNGKGAGGASAHSLHAGVPTDGTNGNIPNGGVKYPSSLGNRGGAHASGLESGGSKHVGGMANRGVEPASDAFDGPRPEGGVSLVHGSSLRYGGELLAEAIRQRAQAGREGGGSGRFQGAAPGTVLAPRPILGRQSLPLITIRENDSSPQDWPAGGLPAAVKKNMKRAKTMASTADAAGVVPVTAFGVHGFGAAKVAKEQSVTGSTQGTLPGTVKTLRESPSGHVGCFCISCGAPQREEGPPAIRRMRRRRERLEAQRRRVERATRDDDTRRLFWFGRPDYMLSAFMYTFYANSLSLALIVFSLWQKLVGQWLLLDIQWWLLLILVLLDVALMVYSALLVLPVYALIQPVIHCPESIVRLASKLGVAPEKAEQLRSYMELHKPEGGGMVQRISSAIGQLTQHVSSLAAPSQPASEHSHDGRPAGGLELVEVPSLLRESSSALARKSGSKARHTHEDVEHGLSVTSLTSLLDEYHSRISGMSRPSSSKSLHEMDSGTAPGPAAASWPLPPGPLRSGPSRPLPPSKLTRLSMGAPLGSSASSLAAAPQLVRHSMPSTSAHTEAMRPGWPDSTSDHERAARASEGEADDEGASYKRSLRAYLRQSITFRGRADVSGDAALISTPPAAEPTGRQEAAEAGLGTEGTAGPARASPVADAKQDRRDTPPGGDVAEDSAEAFRQQLRAHLRQSISFRGRAPDAGPVHAGDPPKPSTLGRSGPAVEADPAGRLAAARSSDAAGATQGDWPAVAGTQLRPGPIASPGTAGNKNVAPAARASSLVSAFSFQLPQGPAATAAVTIPAIGSAPASLPSSVVLDMPALEGVGALPAQHSVGAEAAQHSAGMAAALIHTPFGASQGQLLRPTTDHQFHDMPTASGGGNMHTTSMPPPFTANFGLLRSSLPSDASSGQLPSSLGTADASGSQLLSSSSSANMLANPMYVQRTGSTAARLPSADSLGLLDSTPTDTHDPLTANELSFRASARLLAQTAQDPTAGVALPSMSSAPALLLRQIGQTDVPSAWLPGPQDSTVVPLRRLTDGGGSGALMSQSDMPSIQRYSLPMGRPGTLDGEGDGLGDSTAEFSFRQGNRLLLHPRGSTGALPPHRPSPVPSSISAASLDTTPSFPLGASLPQPPTTPSRRPPTPSSTELSSDDLESGFPLPGPSDRRRYLYTSSVTDIYSSPNTDAELITPLVSDGGEPQQDNDPPLGRAGTNPKLLLFKSNTGLPIMPEPSEPPASGLRRSASNLLLFKSNTGLPSLPGPEKPAARGLRRSPSNPFLVDAASSGGLAGWASFLTRPLTRLSIHGSSPEGGSPTTPRSPQESFSSGVNVQRPPLFRRSLNRRQTVDGGRSPRSPPSPSMASPGTRRVRSAHYSGTSSLPPTEPKPRLVSRDPNLVVKPPTRDWGSVMELFKLAEEGAGAPAPGDAAITLSTGGGSTGGMASAQRRSSGGEAATTAATMLAAPAAPGGTLVRSSSPAIISSSATYAASMAAAGPGSLDGSGRSGGSGSSHGSAGRANSEVALPLPP